MLVFKPEESLTFDWVMHHWVLFSKSLVNAKTGMCIDLSNIESCDTAGLAWVIETKRACDRLMLAWRVVEIPQVVYDMAEFCQIRDIFIES